MNRMFPFIRRGSVVGAALGLALVFLAAAVAASAAEKPKVRAITAFIRIDRAQYQAQVREALDFLWRAKGALERTGYEVQSIRITTQPFPEIARGLSTGDALAFFRAYDELAQKENFDAAIGPAMIQDSDDPRQAELLARILEAAKVLNGSLIVAGEDGVHWNAVRAAARVMRTLAENTPHSQGNFVFAATAMVPAYTPFYPGSHHEGLGHQFAIGLQSANVVAEALVGSANPADARRRLAEALREHAQAIESVAEKLDRDTGWHYMGIDLSPAPLKDVSIGDAIESYTGAEIGSSGTLAAAALITSVLQDVPVKRAGYSGLMLPVLEDQLLAQRWSEGRLSLDALLSYSAVCGTGLDVVPLPGEITEAQLTRIIGDVAALGVKLRKPLSARLLPVAGKQAGEQTEFNDPFLVNATIQPLPEQ